MYVLKFGWLNGFVSHHCVRICFNLPLCIWLVLPVDSRSRECVIYYELLIRYMLRSNIKPHEAHKQSETSHWSFVQVICVN